MQQSRKILLLGAGGHCQSVLDSLKANQEYLEIGIIDNSLNPLKKDNTVLGIPVIGCDDDLLRLKQEGFTDAFITVGSIGDISIRKKIYLRLKEIGFHIPNIIDRSSNVSSYSVLGEGIYIGKQVVINPETRIGNCAIINTSAVVEHQCKIDAFAHVAPGSVLCGSVTIGEGTHIGAGSIVKQGVQIGSFTMIGMGSVVLRDIGSDLTAYGNPCKEV